MKIEGFCYGTIEWIIQRCLLSAFPELKKEKKFIGQAGRPDGMRMREGREMNKARTRFERDKRENHVLG